MDVAIQCSLIKGELHCSLQATRRSILDKLEGLGDYDLRRPMTATGTNLLGVVKHLASEEYGYLGEVFGRPGPEHLACDDDGTLWHNGDMWATTSESTDYILGFYRRACAHADQTVETLELDAPGSVPWWDEDERATTLGVILIRMIGETHRHAGHIDVVRELIDGRADVGHEAVGDDDWWRDYVAQVQEAADTFR